MQVRRVGFALFLQRVVFSVHSFLSIYFSDKMSIEIEGELANMNANKINFYEDANVAASTYIVEKGPCMLASYSLQLRSV